MKHRQDCLSHLWLNDNKTNSSSFSHLFFFLLFYDSFVVRQDFDKNVFSKFESVITYNFINHQDELKTMYLKINYMHNNIFREN